MRNIDTVELVWDILYPGHPPIGRIDIDTDGDTA